MHVEARTAVPGSSAPMARLLSLDALRGLPTGPGRVRIELTGDRWLTGTHLLDGTTGALELVDDDAGRTPTATLTAAGLSALAYGVLDPSELPLRVWVTCRWTPPRSCAASSAGCRTSSRLLRPLTIGFAARRSWVRSRECRSGYRRVGGAAGRVGAAGRGGGRLLRSVPQRLTASIMAFGAGCCSPPCRSS
ncbi:hypothetical protein NKG94_33920 [Micromonospora sp. M12]